MKFDTKEDLQQIPSMNNSFKILKRKIEGLNYKPLIIVELGINHNGELKKAKKLVDEAYKAVSLGNN